MRKSVITIVTLVLFIGVAAPSMAFADDENDDSGWNNIFGNGQGDDSKPNPIKRPHPKPDRESKAKHDEIEGQFENISEVVIPPIVIRPGSRVDPNIYELPVVPNPDIDLLSSEPNSENDSVDVVIDAVSGVVETKQNYLTTQLGQLGSSVTKVDATSNINPNKYKPIQIRKVLVVKTPTDEFMQEATVFSGILGSTAVGLLALAGFSTLRLRKDPKANYIYEAKD
jgi:hypothetical protein